ncbi:unnamed protein product [Protopolystoma xenopodis]|uniref:Uncharacterized protein n=1 Tax=Protopolystoma xenopodis TaxID=117903 RepID=A0A448XLA8_9PLAT|nr:unnamed protein product [Protopolystoma xenopodis]
MIILLLNSSSLALNLDSPGNSSDKHIPRINSDSEVQDIQSQSDGSESRRFHLGAVNSTYIQRVVAMMNLEKALISYMVSTSKAIKNLRLFNSPISSSTTSLLAELLPTFIVTVSSGVGTHGNPSASGKRHYEVFRGLFAGPNQPGTSWSSGLLPPLSRRPASTSRPFPPARELAGPVATAFDCLRVICTGLCRLLLTCCLDSQVPKMAHLSSVTPAE